MEKSTNIINTDSLIGLAKSRSGLTKDVIRRSLRAILGAISEATDDGKIVVLDNFGRFDVRTVKKHTVTPPPPYNTPVTVPEHRVVRFRGFKNVLNYHMKN